MLCILTSVQRAGGQGRWQTALRVDCTVIKNVLIGFCVLCCGFDFSSTDNECINEWIHLLGKCIFDFSKQQKCTELGH